MLGKFKQNLIVQTTRNFELFDKKKGGYENIFDKAFTQFFEDVSVAEIIV